MKYIITIKTGMTKDPTRIFDIFEQIRTAFPEVRSYAIQRISEPGDVTETERETKIKNLIQGAVNMLQEALNL